MRIHARPTLRAFAAKHPDAKGHLDTWWLSAKKAHWRSPTDVKAQFPKASIVGDNRVVFDICGNKYRLVVKFNYAYGLGFVRFVGTHAEYDKIDVTAI